MDGRRHTRKTGEVIDCVRTRSPPLAKRANMGLYRTGFLKSSCMLVTVIHRCRPIVRYSMFRK